MAECVAVCDSCGHEPGGYTRKELEQDGWKWYQAGRGRHLVVCADCCDYYEQRRATKTAAA